MEYRVRVTGDPLDLSTRPSFPKPISHIEIIDVTARLRLEDRKLYNVLLALSWERLGDMGDLRPFSERLVNLRRAIGQVTHNDNRRIKASLDRLLDTKVEFPKIKENGQVGETRTSLISSRTIFDDSVEWNFDPVLRPYLKDHGPWARLHLDVCARFRRQYSLTLYEILSGKVRMNHPYWEVSVGEFRKLFALTDKVNGFAQLERRVIRAAIEEIEEYSSLRVDYEKFNGLGTKAVESMKFTVRDTAREA